MYECPNQVRPPRSHHRCRVIPHRHFASAVHARFAFAGVRFLDGGSQLFRNWPDWNDPHKRTVPLLEQPVDEIIARHDRDAGEPRFVDREAVGVVVTGMTQHIGDREPISDSPLGRKDVNAVSHALEGHVLRADDHGVPGFVEEWHRIDERLDILFARNASNEEGDLGIEWQTETRFHFVATDQRRYTCGVRSVGDDGHIVTDVFGKVLTDGFVHAHNLGPESVVGSNGGFDERTLPALGLEYAVLDVDCRASQSRPQVPVFARTDPTKGRVRRVVSE